MFGIISRVLGSGPGGDPLLGNSRINICVFLYQLDLNFNNQKPNDLLIHRVSDKEDCVDHKFINTGIKMP